MLTNIDINKMNHLLETNEDARKIVRPFSTEKISLWVRKNHFSFGKK